jgi:hypothetical protein
MWRELHKMGGSEPPGNCTFSVEMHIMDMGQDFVYIRESDQQLKRIVCW